MVLSDYISLLLLAPFLAPLFLVGILMLFYVGIIIIRFDVVKIYPVTVINNYIAGLESLEKQLK